ncbi:hypothetical protein [Aphanothece sacrum]|uniref:Uncharacterized protein n=1 Tax=Aphanothece sacrum FPU1 TaxID=1920663 RepID=A0A401IHN5_APHSA|nr:hypothetical protein [Aphanothece sacrum]GBF80807.1 hypothetical protein AsFPU1_2212 [Aphanothece sacrum FPU1]GBF83302.1 hypothetical protein AsFPU3_0342 [Aphanothece sacrum FPU3]
MLSTDAKQESMMKKIEQVVSILMEEDSLFKEELNYSKIVKHLTNLFAENLSFEEFNNISEQSLKNRCRGIMSTELMAGMLDDLTPEEMAIFDEAIKRK